MKRSGLKPSKEPEGAQVHETSCDMNVDPEVTGG